MLKYDWYIDFKIKKLGVGVRWLRVYQCEREEMNKLYIVNENNKICYTVQYIKVQYLYILLCYMYAHYMYLLVNVTRWNNEILNK